jgi:ribosome-binding factor A
MRRVIFEVERCRLKNVGAKFIPSLHFRKDGMAQRTRAVATILPDANFED